MGRKSAKGKERKLKRKEENAICDRHWSIVAEANRVEDPMSSLVSFQKYTQHGLNIKISFRSSSDMPKNLQQWAFDLTKKNMEFFYTESGWGWKDSEKLKEMADDNAKYLIAENEEGKPVAFVHFRFDLDYGLPVVYCYEIHIESEVQRKGLGFFLMQILQLLAIKNGLFKVVATVLRDNIKSLDFFLKKLRFLEDETSPEEESYIIVSKEAKINK